MTLRLTNIMSAKMQKALLILFFQCFFIFLSGQSGNKHLFEVNVNGKWGFIDSIGKISIEPQFDQAYGFKDGFARIKKDDKYGFINLKGEKVVEPKFDYLGDFMGPLAACTFQTESGWVNRKGKFIKGEKNIHGIGPFTKELMWIHFKNGKFALLNENGKKILKPRYEKINSYSGVPSLVKYKGKYGYINEHGKVIIKPRFQDARTFTGNKAFARQNEKWGIINRNGEFILIPQYDDLNFAGEGLISVVANGKIGFIDDSTFKIIVPPRFDRIKIAECFTFCNKIAAVPIGDKIGFINKSGTIVIKPVFDHARNFFSGNIAVEKNGKWGFIDTTGKIIVNMIFDEVGYIYPERIVTVRSGNFWGVINLAGDTVVPFNCIAQPLFENGQAWVLQNDKYRLIDARGKVATECDFYIEGSGFRNGLEKISTKPDTNYFTGSFGYMNRTGILIWKP